MRDDAIRMMQDRLTDEVEGVPRPKTDDELWRLTKRVVGLEIPRKQCCPDHVAPFKVFADAFFARDRVIVVKASRGLGGKSINLASLAMMEGIVLGASVNLLGGSGEQAQRVLEYMNGEEIPGKFWDCPNAPRSMLRGGFERGLLKRATKLKNGGFIRALMASSRSVRGPHPQRLRIDEVDEMTEMLLRAAMGQPMGRGGVDAQTVLSSTHQYAEGTMTWALNQAKEKGWPVYEWCYRENRVEIGGWLEEKEIEGKKGEMTTVDWNTEIELQEPSPGQRAIDDDAVKAMFRRDLGVYEGDEGEYIEIEPPLDLVWEEECLSDECEYRWDDWGVGDPEVGEGEDELCPECGEVRGMAGSPEYANGADWARKKDYTVIVTFRIDCYPAKLVAFERRHRETWPSMVGRFEKRCERYPGDDAHDGTGLGDVIDGYLEGVDAESVWMSGKTRAEMLSNYVIAIEAGEMVAPFIKWMYNSHRLASQGDVFGSGKDVHLPDDISAGSLAWKAGWRRGDLGITV